MVAGSHKKPRFQVDVPRPPQPGAHPLGASLIPPKIRHKRQRFHIEIAQSHRRRNVPEQLSYVVRQLRRRYATTLAQRRQLRKGAILAVVCLSLLAIASTPFVVPLIRAHMQVAPRISSRNTSQSLIMTKATHGKAYLPYDALALHVVTTDRQPPDVSATSAYVFDPEQNWLFFQKDAESQHPMASLTKIMTLLLAAESGDLDQKVSIGRDAAALVNSDNSYMGVSAGEVLSVRELLYGLMVASGNDAAVALADHVSGSQSAFVVQMRNRAAQIGLTHTIFVSPDGADDGNRTSAHDLAVLTAVALQAPGVQQITSTRLYHIAPTNLHKPFDLTSSNDLLPGGRSPYPGANGVKTGFTESAGYCMAFSARVQGHLIVGVVLGDPSPGARTADARALLDWAVAQES